MKQVVVYMTAFLGRFSWWIGFSAVLLILLGGWFWVLEDHIDSLREQGLLALRFERAALEQRRQERDYVRSVAVGLDTLPEGYEEVMDIVLPSEYSPSALLLELDQIVRVSGAQLVSVQVGDPVERAIPLGRERILRAPSAPVEIPVTFTAGGLSYPTMKTLLKHLGESVHIYDIASLSYAPDTTVYTFSAKTYVMP